MEGGYEMPMSATVEPLKPLLHPIPFPASIDIFSPREEENKYPRTDGMLGRSSVL